MSNRSRALSLSMDWDAVMKAGVKKTHEDHPGFELEERERTTFVTRSSYEGEWNQLGMAGFGTYTYPHNVEYEGNLFDGMFEMDGMLTYPEQQRVEATWHRDIMVFSKYLFVDGLDFYDPWPYCSQNDRRYFEEIRDGLNPACFERVTKDEEPRPIPAGCYDTGDGFYNPKTKTVFSALDSNKILRIPTTTEEAWIIANCRYAEDRNVGYRPDFYEHWVSGRGSEEFEYIDDTMDGECEEGEECQGEECEGELEENKL